MNEGVNLLSNVGEFTVIPAVLAVVATATATLTWMLLSILTIMDLLERPKKRISDFYSLIAFIAAALIMAGLTISIVSSIKTNVIKSEVTAAADFNEVWDRYEIMEEVEDNVYVVREKE